METRLSGNAFQILAAATGKARLPTVESLKGGTTRRLVPKIIRRSLRLSHKNLTLYCKKSESYLSVILFRAMLFSKQESRAAARKPRDAAGVLFC